MFLNELNESEKVAFLDLALICAFSSGEYEQCEKDVIARYCAEMGIQEPEKTKKYEYIVDAFTDDIEEYKNKVEGIIEDNFDYVHASTMIAYFELIALIYADGKITEIEDDILKRLQEKIGEDTATKLSSTALAIVSNLKLADNINNLYKKGI